MKKRLFPLIICLVFALVVVACSTSTSSPTQTATTSPTGTTPPATPTVAPTSSAPPTTSTPSPTAGSEKYGGILIEAIASGPTGPFGAPWENSLSPISTQTVSVEALLQEQSDGSLTPNLAESYEVDDSAANPSITFHLRKGVKFHDGTDFNAKAVQFNLQMWKEGNMAIGTTSYWKSIDIIDDYTVRVNLTEWRNYFLRVFGDAQGLQISPTAYETHGIEWLRFNTVSTSAFIQTSFERDVAMTFTRNNNYWDKGKPYLDGIKQVYVADNLTRQLLLKSGGADMIDCNNDNRTANELRNAGFQIYTQPASGFYSLVPDSLNANSPWSKFNVRLAVDYAIDQAGLAQAFGYGYDVEAYQYYPQGSIAHDPSLTPRGHDLAKAKQLLAEAGYPNGFKTTIVVANNAPRDVAVAIQAQLAAVGIEVELQFPQPAAMFQQWTGAGWQNGVQFMTQSLWPNPNANWNLFTGEPPSWFKPVKHPDGWKDMLFESFRTKTPDPTLTKRLEKALYDDITFIPISWHLGTFATSNKVQGTGYGTRGMWTWWNPEDAWIVK